MCTSDTESQVKSLQFLPFPMSVLALSVADVEMRSSSKRPLLDVDSDTVPAWMPAFSEMLGRKLDTKLDGFERKIDQVLGLHQTRLDKHDAERNSQRQLLEDLKTEVSLLRKNSFDTGRMSCDTSSDTASTVGSSPQSEWCPQNVLVRGWAPRPSSKN